MLRTSSVDCRLLSASNCAYYVNAAGHFVPPPNDPFYRNVGFIGKVLPFSGGIDNINSAILGETSDAWILAFRGTLPPRLDCRSILDWLQDIIEIPTISVPDLPGEVYEGAYFALESIKGNIFSVLSKIYGNGKSQKPLYITGHSKGGPMATFATYMAINAGYPVGQITTFASPHPGNQEFAQHYNALVRQTRYENDLDIVPFLPPTQGDVKDMIYILQLIAYLDSSLKDIINNLITLLNQAAEYNYEPVGTLKFITSNHQIVPNSPSLSWYRLYDFLEDFRENGVGTGLLRIADAHSIGCGSGYQKGVCPNLCS